MGVFSLCAIRVLYKAEQNTRGLALHYLTFEN
jgi:hypothetical protein